jgi:hypothetical protein
MANPTQITTFVRVTDEIIIIASFYLSFASQPGGNRRMKAVVVPTLEWF